MAPKPPLDKRDTNLGEGYGGTLGNHCKGMGGGQWSSKFGDNGTSQPPLPQNKSRKHRPATLLGTGSLLSGPEAEGR